MIDLSYSLETPYVSQVGYYNNLTSQQADALVQMENWVAENQINMDDLIKHALHPSLTLLRYLRANRFHVDKAIAHIKRNLIWRKEMQVENLMTKDPEEILGCDTSEFVSVFPHWHSGYDKTGRPVLYKQYGKFDTSKIKQLTTIDDIAKYHIWEQETCMYLCYLQSKQRGHIIETITAVLDVLNMTVPMVTMDFISIVKAIANIDQTQYPETLGKIFVINAPAAFPFVWRMVRGFIDPDVAAKIVVSGKREEWQPLLDEFIGKENLPENYGGMLPALSANIPSYETVYKPIIAVPDVLRYSKSSYSDNSSVCHESSSDAGVHYSDALEGKDEIYHYHRTNNATITTTTNSNTNNSNNHSFLSQPRHSATEGIQSDFWHTIQWIRSGAYSHTTSTSLDIEHLPPPPVGGGSSEVNTNNMNATVVDFDPETGITMTTLEATSTPPLHAIQAKKYHHKNLTLEVIPPSTPHPPSLPTTTSLASRRRRRVCSLLQSISTSSLVKYLQYALLSHGTALLVLLGIASYSLSVSSSSQLWSDTLTYYTVLKLSLWPSVVMIAITSVLIAFTVIGYLGKKYFIRPLLWSYGFSLVLSTAVFLCVGLACLILGLLHQATHPVSITNAIVALGASSIVLSVLSSIPMFLTFELIHRLKSSSATISSSKYRCPPNPSNYILPPDHLEVEKEEEEVEPPIPVHTQHHQKHHLAITLRVIIFLAILISVVMTVYGGFSLYYLFQQQLSYSAFAVYCLLFGGVLLTLTSIFGVWASCTNHEDVLWLFSRVLIPLVLLFLVSAAVFSGVMIPLTDKHLLDSVVASSADSASRIRAAVGTQLLVAAVLFMLQACVHFWIWAVSRKLYHLTTILKHKSSLKILSRNETATAATSHLQGTTTTAILSEYKKENDSRYGLENGLDYEDTYELPAMRIPLSRKEKLLIFWGILAGFYHIFFNGTCVLFASWVNSSDTWIAGAWRLMGRYDKRFLDSDGFIVSSDALLAVLCGPLLLVFAWSTFVRAPWRHTLGIIGATLEIYTQVLYYAIEIHHHFTDMTLSSSSSTALFILIFIIMGILTLLLPLLVMIHESMANTIRCENKEDCISEQWIESQTQTQQSQQQSQLQSQPDDIIHRNNTRSYSDCITTSTTTTSVHNHHHYSQAATNDGQNEAVTLGDGLRSALRQRGGVYNAQLPPSDSLIVKKSNQQGHHRHRSYSASNSSQKYTTTRYDMML